MAKNMSSYFSTRQETKLYGLKLGSDRALEHIRARAPRYQGARPNISGRAPQSCKLPFFSLLHRIFPPVRTNLSPFSLRVLVKFLDYKWAFQPYWVIWLGVSAKQLFEENISGLSHFYSVISYNQRDISYRR